MTRILVTGSSGVVGSATVTRLQEDGHEVIGTDLRRPDYHAPGPTRFVQADLTDAGHAFDVVAEFDVVIHTAAIPEPTQNPAHVVFGVNVMSTFNVVEACVRAQVPRMIHLSSETVTGMAYAIRMFLPDYAPLDESHPVRPQDSYGLSKQTAESLVAAATRRTGMTGISLRPAWVQTPATYRPNLATLILPERIGGLDTWAYTDLDDLVDAIALAVSVPMTGYEVCYVANPDNIGGWDFAATVRQRFPSLVLRNTSRVDASGINSSHAVNLLGWRPRRSWRDHLE